MIKKELVSKKYGFRPASLRMTTACGSRTLDILADSDNWLLSLLLLRDGDGERYYLSFTS